MSDTLPTFRNNKDRWTYLAAEYSRPIAVAVLAAGAWLAWAQPQLPTPTQQQLSFATSWAILSIPVWFLGKRVAGWFNTDHRYRIGIASDREEGYEYDGQRVPVDLWEEKTVTGASPFEPDEGIFDYVVVRFEWYEELGELEVRGVERSDLTPGEAMESAARVEEYHENHHELTRMYSRLKGLVQSYASEIHDLTVMNMMAQREEAELSIDKSVSGLVEEMEQDVQDLPDGPADTSTPTHGQRLDARLDDLEVDAIPEPTAADGGTR
jgi:hypothetical protein